MAKGIQYLNVTATLPNPPPDIKCLKAARAY